MDVNDGVPTMKHTADNPVPAPYRPAGISRSHGKPARSSVGIFPWASPTLSTHDALASIFVRAACVAVLPSGSVRLGPSTGIAEDAEATEGAENCD